MNHLSQEVLPIKKNPDFFYSQIPIAYQLTVIIKDQFKENLRYEETRCN